ncbi:glycoside hydrolase family 3 N-terminal domain-containing protein [Thermogemmatispora sp.]|uniref:glycoside hydrolase family 3 N-terminal domain-containing protein n=1 Tax=Thermogemmatispora sp. TaxID=1968838 RepID=UPI0035E448AB
MLTESEPSTISPRPQEERDQETETGAAGRSRRQERRSQRPRSVRRFLLLSLGSLLLLATALLGKGDLALGPRQASQLQETLLAGPFITNPLTPAQVEALRHREAAMNEQALAHLYLSHMTLDQKLGQLFMVQYYGTTYSADLETMIHDLYAGGVIMYAAQMRTFQQTRADIQHMQARAWMPLFISADEEGGFVERINNIYGHRPGALEIYQTGKVSNAAALGRGIAHDLKALGLNTDLAPDVDVPVVNGPDQYLRTWGYTPQSVIDYGGAYLRAVQGAGVIACLKHFPGLGAAQTDAHTDLPVIKRSREQIYSTELVPFKYFVQSSQPLDHPGMIMTTDLLMPALDPVWPAELSPTIVTGILRHELGYNGVVITDALYMEGIAKKWSLPEAVVLALAAGNDMILGVRSSYDLRSAVAAIKQALASGQLSQSAIDASVTRIVALKLHYHLWPLPRFV